jgi:membrane protein YqaA with SNARE-associated domain
METGNTPYDALDSSIESKLMVDREHNKVAGTSWLSKKMIVRVLAIMAVIAVSASIFVFRDQVSHLQSYGYIGAFLIALVTTATIILPVPGIILIVALGTVPEYNPVLIGVAAGAGSALGELTGYMAGFSGQLVFENIKYYRQLKQWMQRRGSIVLFVLAFVPNPLFDIAGAIAGLLRYPVWKFLLACFLGKTLRYILVASFGWFVGVSWF